MSNQNNNMLIFTSFVLAIAALMVATGIGRFVFTPIIPLMLDEKIVILDEVIWLSSANYIGYFVGAMTLFKNHRHLLFMLMGLSLVTVATLLSSLDNFGWIFLFRFLAGVGGAWALISTTAWAIPWLQWLAVQRIGFVYTGVGGGIAISGAICSLLTLQHWSSSHIWYAIAGLALMLSTFVVISLRWVLSQQHQQAHHKKNVTAHLPTKQEQAENDFDPLQSSSKTSLPVWRLAMAYGLFGFGYIIPATFLPKIAKDMVSGNAFLLVWPVFGLASVIGVSLTQKFSHVSDVRIWQIAQSTLGLATLLPLLSKSIPSLLVTALLVGGTFMVVIMSILKIAANLVKPYNVVALMTASFAFGQLAGPLPALFLSEQAMWSVILPVSSFASLLGVALLWQSNHIKEK